MHNINDEDYLQIVDLIIKNKQFLTLENIDHHNTNRLDHSLKVSYNSYKIARFLNLILNKWHVLVYCMIFT
jgi:uncharacterized protein